MDHPRHVAEIVRRAEIIRVLYYQRGRGAVQRGGYRRAVERGIWGSRQIYQLYAQIVGVRADHLAVDRVDAAGYDHLVASGHVHGHHDRLGQGRAAVIHRSVGGIHPGQAADHGLVLEDRLQRALRDFRLIRRVSGEKLAARSQAVNRGRYGMVVKTAAQKTHQRVRVAVRQLVQAVVHLLLAQAVGHVQGLHAQMLRYVGEKPVQRAHADRGQHFGAVLIRVRNESHVLTPASSRNQRIGPRPSDRRGRT